ncbi:hypothetical protein SARC_04008 [Sphaeroforma arctica JP610]|uniref:Uncharacterized protein n=1 Tax=Sphaeroforma arctica JP610 TaxID=667725 RepID=A0A0L0G6B6_9EUKA|nr:hypothetical protein SARC_04008 [Sphaeroforma arctica JP610]KNC83758.1 hypothetical protein SARC_04008 [Sphaeroforma arctica JP610]|eukprot:XP_014157660.1 hypothetical protein SARC_04008 [Sphaeroforma arctica JP610]
MTVSVDDVAHTLQLTRAANADLHRVLAEVNALFDTLKMYKLFNPQTNDEQAVGVEQEPGTANNKTLKRSESQRKDTTEDGAKSNEEFNERLAKRLESYNTAIQQLRDHLQAINRICPAEWVGRKEKVVLTEQSEMSAADTAKYLQLEAQRNHLRVELEKRNTHLTVAIAQLRNISSVMATTSNVRQL